MMSLLMGGTPAMTGLAPSGSCIISLIPEGTTCQERPNLSLSQPYGLFSPLAERFSQDASISAFEPQARRDLLNLSHGNDVS